MNETIYWTFFHEGPWRFLLAATDKGLCFTGSQEREMDELETWAAKQFKGSILEENAKKLESYYEEFLQYVNGQRKELTFALDFKGTDFQRSVWQALQQIPFGVVITYSDVAEKINKPKAVRAVGTAIGANPVMVAIPCHRVIGKNGTLTGFRGGLELKKMLLDLEGKHHTM